MISKKTVQEQLKKIDFNPYGWNRSEIAELHQILLPDEQIYECVNGTYEGGFALLVATDIRVLLVDKKPLNFLSVEDLRFDMINEIDYNHRMMGASINISTGSKVLNFRSYNKSRLRKLIGHVQHCMAENKKKVSSHAEGQNQHLEQINQQLQAYLVAQYKQQQKLQEHIFKGNQPQAATAAVDGGGDDKALPEPIKPSNELADYLYAHGLLETYRKESGKDPSTGQPIGETPKEDKAETTVEPQIPVAKTIASPNSQLNEIYAEGLQEVFGNRQALSTTIASPQKDEVDGQVSETQSKIQFRGLEINPIKIAYSKLPALLNNRKFGLALPSLPSVFPLPMPSSNKKNTQEPNAPAT
jgi:hypothetical protein